MGDTPKTVTTMVGSVHCAVCNAYKKIVRKTMIRPLSDKKESITLVDHCTRVAELGSLSSVPKRAMKIFVKRVLQFSRQMRRFCA